MKIRSGFSHIELLVVIAIITILTAILFPVFARAKASTKASACLSNAKQIELEWKMYAKGNGDIMPPPPRTSQNCPAGQFGRLRRPRISRMCLRLKH